MSTRYSLAALCNLVRQTEQRAYRNPTAKNHRRAMAARQLLDAEIRYPYPDWRKQLYGGGVDWRKHF